MKRKVRKARRTISEYQEAAEQRVAEFLERHERFREVRRRPRRER